MRKQVQGEAPGPWQPDEDAVIDGTVVGNNINNINNDSDIAEIIIDDSPVNDPVVDDHPVVYPPVGNPPVVGQPGYGQPVRFWCPVRQRPALNVTCPWFPYMCQDLVSSAGLVISSMLVESFIWHSRTVRNLKKSSTFLGRS